MLKSLYIDNFKALNAFSMDLNLVTVLIGNNSAGKSSILQAIAFLKACCMDSASQYWESRGLALDELCSKLGNQKTMTFIFTFDFDHKKEVIWEIQFLVQKIKGRIELQNESIHCGKDILLQYSNTEACYRYDEAENAKDPIMHASYKFSLLSLLDEEKDNFKYPTLLAIKQFFEETEPLDLLSPKDMRKSARGRENTIGQSGEKLPAFIQGLSAEDKKELTTILHRIFPQITEIRAIVRGRPGWTHLEVNETYGQKEYPISSNNISDGMLRLIALFSIKYMKKSGGILLLDEIEDGINSENMETLMDSLQRACEEKKQQLLATTHNTVLLDYIRPEQIRYITRDRSGNVMALNLFEYPELKEKLKYMYPGEIILNSSNTDLSNLAEQEEHAP